VNISREEAVMILVISMITITAAFAKYFFASAVPRQCPLVLLMEGQLREGKTIGSVKGETLGSEFCYEQRKEFE
jgi:hypothetical protein